MQECCALVLAYLAGAGVCVVIAVAVKDDLCTVALGSLDLSDRRACGHYYGGGYAELVRCVSNALRMVAG